MTKDSSLSKSDCVVPSATFDLHKSPVAARHRYKWVKVAQVLFTVLILWFILRKTTVTDFLHLLQGFAPEYLLGVVVTTILSATAGAASLLMLFDLHGHWRWRARFSLDYLYVQAICQLTPAQMGEAFLPYIAGRNRFAPGAIAAALVVQRIVSLILVVLFAISSARSLLPENQMWTIVAAVLLLCTVLIFLINNAAVRTCLNMAVGRRFGPILSGFYVAWKAILLERPARLLMHGLFMTLRYFLSVAASYFIFAAFGVQIPFLELAALTAVAILASLVPLTINGIGITEGIFVLALTGYGYTADRILVACLGGRLMTALVMAGSAALYIVVEWYLGPRRMAAGTADKN